MSTGRTLRALAIAAGVCGVLAAPAAADETIYAGPPFQFYTPQVTIDQGERLTFTNLDPIGHDVVADADGPDGKPWFRSEIVSGGESSEVTGADMLVTGSYGFLCSIHPAMVGTVTVTAAGTPKPRPGAQPAPPPPAPAEPPKDTTAPSVTLAVADSRVAKVRRRRALRVKVGISEPATVVLTVRAGRRAIATGTFAIDAAKTVAVRLSAAGRRAVRKARRLKLSVSAEASDAAGNRATARAARTLR